MLLCCLSITRLIVMFNFFILYILKTIRICFEYYYAEIGLKPWCRLRHNSAYVRLFQYQQYDSVISSSVGAVRHRTSLAWHRSHNLCSNMHLVTIFLHERQCPWDVIHNLGIRSLDEAVYLNTINTSTTCTFCSGSARTKLPNESCTNVCISIHNKHMQYKWPFCF